VSLNFFPITNSSDQALENNKSLKRGAKRTGDETNHVCNACGYGFRLQVLTHEENIIPQLTHSPPTSILKNTNKTN
jgi:hypothetical protein